LASDPGLDFYVAERNGAIQGALLVCYVGRCVCTAGKAFLMLRSQLFDRSTRSRVARFRQSTARKRGCRQLLLAPRGGRKRCLAALTQGGFHPEEKYYFVTYKMGGKK
jgi:hypothetical protein